MVDVPCVRVWQWAVRQPGPHLRYALPAMEAVRAAATRVRHNKGLGRFPESFHGGKNSDHRHAFWLPEDTDGDGLIDRILVCCGNGIDADTIAGLAFVKSFSLLSSRYGIIPCGMGPRPHGGLFGPARRWVALTPVVTARNRHTKTGELRADEEPSVQLEREIEMRQLPKAVEITGHVSIEVGEERLFAHQFVTTRKKGPPPEDAVASFPTICFSDDVWGPLALGYGAHFGLGLLIPAI